MTIHNLILWRHAEAEIPGQGQADLDRALTLHGHQQARRMAAWLNKNLPEQTVAMVSPALRTRETVAYWGTHWHVEKRLAPDSSLQAMLRFLEQTSYEHLMLVGHQPWLGMLAAHYLGMHDKPLDISKGAVWWLQLPKSGRLYTLYSVQTPELVP